MTTATTERLAGFKARLHLYLQDAFDLYKLELSSYLLEIPNYAYTTLRQF